jgi:putative aminopeptidase FrvX
MRVAETTPMFDLIKTLTEIPGPIGQEELVHEWCANHWSRYAEEVQITPVGNVVARVGGTPCAWRRTRAHGQVGHR